MPTAINTVCGGRRGEAQRRPRLRACRRAQFVAAAVAVVLSGCFALEPYEPEPAPPPRSLPRGQPLPPPRQTMPQPQPPLASLPHDEEGLGRGPLGRAGVLLDRSISAAEQAQRRGDPIDAAELAHLRMTRQARDLIATGENERATDLLERAIAIDDGSGFGYLYLGYVHLAAGRPDQADVFLDRAASLLPADPALRVEIEQLRSRADAASVPLAASP
jgi:hypothetical protein